MPDRLLSSLRTHTLRSLQTPIRKADGGAAPQPYRFQDPIAGYLGQSAEQMRSGWSDLWDPSDTTAADPAWWEKKAQGAHNVIAGSAPFAAPLIIPGLAAAPLTTLGGLAGATLASKPAEKLALKAGVPSGQAALFGDVAGFGAGATASGLAHAAEPNIDWPSVLQKAKSERGAITIGPSEGWQSGLRNTVAKKMPNRASPEQVRSIMSTAPAEELQYSKATEPLQEAYPGQPVSKDYMLAHLDESLPKLQETTRTDQDVKYKSWATPGTENYREVLLQLPDKPVPEPTVGNYLSYAKAHGYDDAAVSATWHTNDPMFKQWQAENTKAWENYNAARRSNYQSGHWDEPNVLAHMRLADHVGADGKKTLLIDEIQSDWHQTGRQHGYFGGPEQPAAPTAPSGWEVAGESRGKVPDAPFKKDWHELAFKRALQEAVKGGYDRIAWTTGEQQAERYDLSKHISNVSWHPDSGLIAENHAGRIVMNQPDVTLENLDDYVGKEVADKLRTKWDENAPSSRREDFEIVPETEPGRQDQFYILDPNGEPVRDRYSGDIEYFSHPNRAREHLEYMLEEDTRMAPSATISGLDLKVGGEGMKGFYDQMLPSFANKYVKRWGAKVGTTTLGTGLKVPAAGNELLSLMRAEDSLGFDTAGGALRAILQTPDWEARWDMSPRLREMLRDYRQRAQVGKQFHSLDITPAMRQSIQQGQPMWGNALVRQQGGLIRAATLRSLRGSYA